MSSGAPIETVASDAASAPMRWTLADAEQSVVAPFERLAAQHPDALAIFADGEHVTYGELNARANRLAHDLIARAARGDRVALALDHDDSMITGLLAAWKAGMVAVPLEITNPLARLATIVGDAGCTIIVSSDAHASVAEAFAGDGASIVDVDELAADLPIVDPRIDVAAGELACLIYTSGSTGKPKGVMQTHRQMMRNVVGYSAMMEIAPRDRFLLVATCAAAQGLAAVLCALENGASVFPFNVRQSGVEKLTQFIREQEITITIFAATVFRHLVLTLHADDVLDSVRLVRLGSEPVHGSDAVAFRQHFGPECVLLTALSSTETANFSLYRVDIARDAEADSIPVGWPVDGMEVLLLDEAGRDVGYECEGEIVVRSRYLSPGYWRDAERTAAVFTEPLDGSDVRTYRTGDLGRRRADGCLVHAGRRDFRVKVRGFGVELEEVETVLRQHPRLRSAVASVRPDKLGESQLVAHVVAVPGALIALEELQRHVLGRLAAHMLPAEFFLVDALPFTPNGKVDRRAVAALAGDPLRASVASVPPRNALERKLVQIWEDVLRYRPIGVDNDFFSIGGNSLLAGLVLTRVAATFAVELPVRAFLTTPTIAALARLVRTKRLAGAGAGDASALVRLERGAPIAASFAQQRLWLLDRLEPGSNAYNVPRAIRLSGRLDVDALERALREIVRRHETLRTSFATLNDELVQIISERADFALAKVDCNSRGESEHALREQLEAEALRPFDLQRGPLFRATLFRRADDEHELLLNLHHVISDLWSRSVLTSELTELYNAFSTGRASPLSDLPVQYADYAVWQRRWLQGDLLKRQSDYWSAKLAGLPALDLPTDRPRPREPATSSAFELFEIPSELTTALGQVARENQSTLYMTLLAVFQAQMHRYTGQEDFAVGGVVAGRNRVEVENLIGFFVNTLVHRADVSGDPTFRELLARVRETVLGALEHQDLPFERLVELLNPPRVANRPPFFQVTFLLQNAPRVELAMSGLTAVPFETVRGAAKFDLTFGLHEEGGRLRGIVEYNPALFDRATVLRMIGHYCVLCESVARDSSSKVAELSLLTPTERQELLVDFNRSPLAPSRRTLPLDGGATLAALFEAQVARTPDALALTFEGESLSYAALDARAAVLAARLRALGVGPEVIVGLYLERSLDLVVAILAVLKSGGAYLPIDLAYPAERVAFMLEDAQAHAVVTQGKLRTQLPATKAAIVCSDELDSTTASFAPDALVVTADHLAYVIYTSGTTGKPKGTPISHRNAVRLFAQTEHLFSFDGHDVSTFFHSSAFDMSVWEIWSALLFGGRLVIVPQSVARAPDAFYALLARERVTVLSHTPSAFRPLMQAEDAVGPLPLALRLVFLGGEALDMQSLRPWFARHGDKSPRVINGYGPTETTVYVTFKEVTRADVERGSVIGRPIPDVQGYILDARRQPVPIGIAGELYFGGAGLGRGYLRRPELTAERFVPDHLTGATGARLYRTGDLARFLPDGQIEYLGRIDHQVKIRGFRIELGEIESVLMTHPRVREVVVVAHKDQIEDPRLVAYIVARETGSAPSSRELREHLRQKLPDYMVPAAFVVLERLPLTTNGKLDRRALPAPEESRRSTETEFIEPATPMEKIVADVWRELLRVERVGCGDNFFELGGHSLLAMQVSARIGTRVNRLLPLRWLFDHPTVEALAAKLSEGTNERPVQTIPRARRDGPLPLSHEELRLWFIHHAGSNPAIYNVQRASRLRGPFDVERVRAAFTTIVKRHEILRTAYVAHDGVPARTIVDECAVPFTMENVLERDVAQRVLDEARKPFALETAPLLRVTCLRITPEEHVLLVVIHHIICDEWSFQILSDEIESIYTATSERPVFPPALPYADYAAWQRARDEGSAFDDARKFWRENLVDAPPPLVLPTDHVRPVISRGRGLRHAFTLERSLVAKIEDVGATTAATPFKVWLALFAAHLARMTGESDIVIGTPLANRRRPELQRSIGFFLNTLPLRLRLDFTQSFVELVSRVRRETLLAFEHGELPLDEIVAGRGIARTAPGATLFSVMFVLLDEAQTPWRFPPAETEVLRVGAHTTKCDLTFFAERTSDGGFGCLFEADADLFLEETIVRMAEQFRHLLTIIANAPYAPVQTLPPLPVAQRDRVFAFAGHEAVRYPRDTPVHALFAEQSTRALPPTALVCGSEQVSYRELDERANRLAHHLLQRGVRAGVFVGVLLDRSVEFVVSVLAVLKVGAAYVPLNPHDPAVRVRFILEDTRAAAVIVAGSLPLEFGELKTGVIDLVAEGSTIAAMSSEAPDVSVGGGDAAYVIYTSGSTGQPKGVVVPHRAIARLVRGQTYARFGPGERFMFLASPGFDASTFELWGPLLNGATCVIFPERWPDLERLENEVRAHGVTCLWLTAGLFNQIIDQRPSVLATLAHVLTGGETLSVPHVRRAFEVLPSLRITNGYGPTECTTFACTHAIARDEEFPNGCVPIGRPIANTHAYILDEQRRLVPIGAPGELYLGGDGLAIGYLRRPELTAEKFVADPFADDPAARLYRTGDTCRWRADGTIEFLGRLDDQVKVRGFRVELGEIEAALCEHAAVSRAAVATRKGANGVREIAAFVVARDGAVLDACSLRAHVSARLPDYMVPASFAAVESLPLNASGKIDRAALLAQATRALDAADSFVAPRDATEVALAEIWRGVLARERIGVTENFFALGGHSLLAMRLVFEIGRRFGRSVPLAALFAAPTIEGLARRIAAPPSGASAAVAPKLRGHGPGTPLFHIPGLGGYEFLPVAVADRLAGERPFFDGLQFRGLDGRVAPVDRVEQIASDLVAQIRDVRPRGPYCFTGYCFGGLVAFEVARQFAVAGETVESIVLWDSFPAKRWRRRTMRETAAFVMRRLRAGGPGGRADFFLSRLRYAFGVAGRRVRRMTAGKGTPMEFELPGWAKGVPEGPQREVVAAAYRASRTYRAQPYDGRVVVVRTKRERLLYEQRPLDGWDGIARGSVEFRDMLCDHFEMLREPAVQQLAEMTVESLRTIR